MIVKRMDEHELPGGHPRRFFVQDQLVFYVVDPAFSKPSARPKPGIIFP